MFFRVVRLTRYRFTFFTLIPASLTFLILLTLPLTVPFKVVLFPITLYLPTDFAFSSITPVHIIVSFFFIYNINYEMKG